VAKIKARTIVDGICISLPKYAVEIIATLLALSPQEKTKLRFPK
jgi:hypothetical protein